MTTIVLGDVEVLDAVGKERRAKLAARGLVDMILSI
jgi:hypothetical protein